MNILSFITMICSQGERATVLNDSARDSFRYEDGKSKEDERRMMSHGSSGAYTEAVLGL